MAKQMTKSQVVSHGGVAFLRRRRALLEELVLLAPRNANLADVCDTRLGQGGQAHRKPGKGETRRLGKRSIPARTVVKFRWPAFKDAVVPPRKIDLHPLNERRAWPVALRAQNGSRCCRTRGNGVRCGVVSFFALAEENPGGSVS